MLLQVSNPQPHRLAYSFFLFPAAEVPEMLEGQVTYQRVVDRARMLNRPACRDGQSPLALPVFSESGYHFT
jgi:hypothetical protein